MAAPEVIFYDGGCGLCHASVKFVLARDREGRHFNFAALDSDAYREAATAEARERMGDSVVVRTEEGRLLVRSAAVRHILSRLGGGWGLLGRAMGVVPRAVLDVGYRGLARVRRLLTGRPKAACPMLTPRERERFLE